MRVTPGGAAHFLYEARVRVMFFRKGKLLNSLHESDQKIPGTEKAPSTHCYCHTGCKPAATQPPGSL